MRLSNYKSASFEPIHAHSLFLVSWFLSYLSGKSALPNGGVVLAAMSQSNSPSVSTLRSGLDQLEAQQMHQEHQVSRTPESLTLPFVQATGHGLDTMQARNLFVRHDWSVLEALGVMEPGFVNPETSPTTIGPAGGAQSPKVLRLNGLAISEARSLMQYWARSGMMRSDVNDRVLAGKWAASGNGLVGELEKGCVSMRM